MSLTEQLQNRGIAVFRSAVAALDVNKALTTINTVEQSIDYQRMKTFIDTHMMGTLQRELGWTKPSYLKYRVSDKTNAADASTFHRDTFPLSEEAKTSPIYTCLMYLDRTVMEVVPGSHLKPVMSFTQAIREYPSKERLVIEPGDVVIFHQYLLHRGIFTERLPHRRLIQVFEVFPDVETRAAVEPFMLHLPSRYSSSATKVAVFASEWDVIITPINWVGYMNAATGYGYHRFPLVKAGLDQYRTISSEGLRPRLTVELGTFQPLNYYIIVADKTADMPVEAHDAVYHDCYIMGRNTYGAMLVALIVAIAWLIKRAVTSKTSTTAAQ